MPFESRQLRLTEETIALVEESLRRSPSWEAAARYAGCSSRTIFTYRDTLTQYEERPDDDLAGYRWDAAKRWMAALSALEMQCAQGLLAAGEKDWKAYLQILRAIERKTWSDRVELTGADGAALIPDAEEMARRIDEAYERAKAKDAPPEP